MTSTAHRETRASRIVLVPLLICAVCCALVILGCRHEHRLAPESDLDAARNALVALFEEADAFDVYRCAGDRASEQYLGTVSRGEEQGLWHELIGSLHRAGPPVPDQCGPSLRIYIREGEKALADAWSCPAVDELRVWLVGRGLIEVTVDSPFKELLRSYHDKAAVAGESSAAERSQPGAEPPLPTFEEVKARLADQYALQAAVAAAEAEKADVGTPGFKGG